MEFSDKELTQIVDRKIDKIVFYSSDKPVFSVNIEEQIKKRIESDPNLKKQLISQVLRSDS